MRGRILDAAFSLFQSQGYNGTSVQQVAAEAGVTGGALHHHFPSKKDLGLCVVAERVADALELTWLAPIRIASSPSDAVLQLFETLAGQLDAQGTVRGCPVNNLTLELAFADPDFRAELGGIFKRWRATLAEQLRSSGCPRPGGLAALMIAAYSGAMAMAKAEQHGEPLRASAAELRELINTIQAN